MTVVTKNLGQVAALFISTASPSNTKMVWYDSNSDTLKYYNIGYAAWVPFISTLPSFEKGIIAYNLGGQALATPLLKTKNRIDSVPDNNASVLLLPAIAGTEQEIWSSDLVTSNDLAIYPQSGDKFLDKAINIPITVVANQKISIFCFEDGVWSY